MWAPISLDDVDRLGYDDDVGGDQELLAAAMARIVSDSGNRHFLSEDAAEFCVDLDGPIG